MSSTTTTTSSSTTTSVTTSPSQDIKPTTPIPPTTSHTPTGLVRVDDSFIQGDFRSAANKVRTATVTLRCCKLEEWNAVQGLAELGYDI